MNKEKRKRYSEKWETISQRIKLERAANKCERCQITNSIIIKRTTGTGWRTATEEELKQVAEFKLLHKSKHFSTLKYFGLTQIVLTVAHLNHNEQDDREENLLAMCQRCHLIHDRQNNRVRSKIYSNSQSLTLFNNSI